MTLHGHMVIIDTLKNGLGWDLFVAILLLSLRLVQQRYPKLHFSSGQAYFGSY